MIDVIRRYTGNLFNYHYLNDKSKLPQVRNYTAQGCHNLKEIRLYVTRQNRILTLDDVNKHLSSIGKKMGVENNKATIHFYEKSGLISYVPDYYAERLMFCNTKYFKKWKKQIEEQYGTFNRYYDFNVALRSVEK